MQKTIEEMSLNELIGECLSKARAEAGSRENSLVLTKLEEAMMWHSQHQKSLLTAARRAGVGFNPNAQSSPMPPPIMDPAGSDGQNT